jgi:hypothetical protein
MEALNNAARAAGFAMAVSEDAPNQEAQEQKLEQQSWRAGEPVLGAPNGSQSTLERVKHIFGLWGRGAPA